MNIYQINEEFALSAMEPSVQGLVALHENQLWGKVPYTVHLENVVRVSTSLDPRLIVAKVAWLHDVVEDTDASIDEIPSDLRSSVMLLSRNISQGELSYFEYIEMIADSSDDVAKLVKFSDAVVNWSLSMSNNSSLVTRYERSLARLYPAVFNEAVNLERVSQLSSLVQLS